MIKKRTLLKPKLPPRIKIILGQFALIVMIARVLDLAEVEIVLPVMVEGFYQ